MSTSVSTERRRADVRRAELNGVDGVEVADDGVTLTVTFLGKAPADIGPENIRIDGGRRVTGIEAVDVEIQAEDDPDLDDHMVVTVDRTGDTSPYTLSVVEPDAHGRPGTAAYEGFDPRYAGADFVFHPGCPADHDCVATEPCPPAAHPEPVIDYTARDYATLRRLLLDRMTLTVPNWTERHVPDLGVTLVELLAHLGDQASYHQDAVAAEAYLDTARRRVSVRRHVRLVDYAMHDGCNARAFVTVRTGRPLELEAGEFRFAAIDVSRVDPRDRVDLGAVMSDADLVGLPAGTTSEVFEPVGSGPFNLYPAHNRITLWAWGEQECVLPRGATSATLRDAWESCAEDAEGAERVPAEDGTRDAAGEGDEPAGDQSASATGHRPGRWRRRALRLRPGDVILIEEVIGPRTGAPADADPAHRQAVRLMSVTPGADELYGQPVAEVTWADEDALEFAVCVSTRGGPDCARLSDVSVVRGNVVLVDHGRDLAFCGGPRELIAVPPGAVTAPSCAPPAFGCGDRSQPDAAVAEIHRLLAMARAGRPLTVDEVAVLRPFVGTAALDRARLTGDTPAARQAAALEALLAQVTYPPYERPFSPVLTGTPVTQRTVHPEPERIAAGQAALLDAIPGRILARLEELARKVRGHRHDRRRGDRGRLSDREIDELRVLVGQAVLDELRVEEHPAWALREMIARFDELLAGKLARLRSLRDRAREGEVLGTGIGWEVEQSLGAGYADGLDPGDPRLAGPAGAALAQDVRGALPAVTVSAFSGDDRVGVWRPRRDLLASGARDRHFVGELGDDGRLALRFGDGRRGAPLPAGGLLKVRYRVGNGIAGNVGAEAIGHLVLCRRGPGGSDAAGGSDGGGLETDAVLAVRNPLPAVGGLDPEPIDQVRRLAPLALRRTRTRAVTAADYAEFAGRVPGVQRAAAEVRWTGSGEEVHVVVDALERQVRGPRRSVAAGAAAEAALVAAVHQALEPYRRIGHDLVVGPALRVPLDLELAVCVAAGYQRGHVLDALRRVLGSGRSPGGLGFFHPDALTFGEPIRVSRIVAVAAAVPGVLSVQVTRLRRLFRQDFGELAEGLLRIGPLEIAQLDDDADRPENGRLTIRLGGGR
ncbi:putative baseplate assembly protein [Actinomadura sp. HBU206391]|uniref:putative baseplate assembly protein n=1 Tax=Actinomadura sp. HBU206391 TaxID=2731692 RepID=UPI00165076B6|nr:putative baseplate assembly protein [Actinomadura sp. HBU206391]MBC6461722.1 putative baseplate assembly protein [Actinomadura sp. HBU206391]